jgi:hypothetical protein
VLILVGLEMFDSLEWQGRRIEVREDRSIVSSVTVVAAPPPPVATTDKDRVVTTESADENGASRGSRVESVRSSLHSKRDEGLLFDLACL